VSGILLCWQNYATRVSRPRRARSQKRLVGDYRPEHLFTLRQSLAAYRYYQQLIAACDVEIECCLATFPSKVDLTQHPLQKSQDRHKPRRNELRFDLRSHLYRIFGVDLTQIPGVNTLTAHTLLAEIGPDLSCFANASAFVSWLGLCPDNRISGGKILSVKTRTVKNRAATALRMAAQSLHRSHSSLGQYYRRMRTKLGTPKAITAAAHKLARIIYHLLTTRKPYEESICAQHEVLYHQQLEARLRKHARALGFELTPKQTSTPAPCSSVPSGAYRNQLRRRKRSAKDATSGGEGREF
jgi:transposase